MSAHSAWLESVDQAGIDLIECGLVLDLENVTLRSTDRCRFPFYRARGPRFFGVTSEAAKKTLCKRVGRYYPPSSPCLPLYYQCFLRTVESEFRLPEPSGTPVVTLECPDQLHCLLNRPDMPCCKDGRVTRARRRGHP